MESSMVANCQTVVDACGRILNATSPYGELSSVWNLVESTLRRVASQACHALLQPQEANMWLLFCVEDLKALRGQIPPDADFLKELTLLQALVGLLLPEE